MTEFTLFGLDAQLMKNIAKAGYDTATPIQAKAIPLVLDGHDVMGLAQTGTGKTAAFGLPMVHRLLEHREKPHPKSVRALILAPTRELVNQICDNLKVFVAGTPLKVNYVVGGQSINRQTQQLARGTDILVATPGRLIDLLERKAVYLNSATSLVLDEADQMLDLGFIHALRQIAPLLGTPRQTMLFSATMPKQMEELSAAYLTNPRRVQVSPPGKAADKITQELHYVQQAGKPEKLKECLRAAPGGQAIVFSRTKHGAEKLMKSLVADGFKAVSVHGNKSQGQRDRAIRAFKAMEANILVATDVAARGIDIPSVTHVYNYDLPDVAENYVHRIGRTARAGKDGKAIAFVGGPEIGLLRDIQKVMKMTIPVASGIEPAEEDRPGRKQQQQKSRRRFGGNKNAGGGRPQGERKQGGRPNGGKSFGKPKGKPRSGSRRRKPAA
ncbi:DEAD/DEAH box helicase [Cognatishimia sp. MH4019]|uniref:DEAD/DEAH box helicase n=1 Tax=Cognatishimia sp. MH4019 TaxID=2854030 RepID=UPI00351CE7FF